MTFAGPATAEHDAPKLPIATASADPAAGQYGGTVTSLMSVEHDLSLRLRPELLWNGDLGNTATTIPRALNLNEGDPSTLAWTSLRARYSATVHMGQRFRLRTSLDAFNNLVLGSTPASGSGSFTDGTLDGGQEAGALSMRDTLRVREAFGSWRFIDWLDIDFGRMSDHFGLGLIRNRGDCTDCDGGTIVDGLRIGLEAFDFRLEASMEMTDTGPLDDRTQGVGQPRDLGIDDDTSTYTLRLISSRQASLSKRQRGLSSAAEAGFHMDWGLFASFTQQSLNASPTDLLSQSSQCEGQRSSSGDVFSLPYDCWELAPRELFIWRPSLWTRLDWTPGLDSRLRVEMELSANLGDVKFLQGLPELGDTSKEFSGFAGALEIDYQSGRMSTGLDVGFATGDDRHYLGVLDGQNIIDPDDANYEANDNVRTNAVVTSFWFNRDYRLDMLLFREVMGGVTNAYYVKPWVAYRLLDTEATRLSLRLDVAYAGAMKAEGTPGGGSHWGIEVDTGLTLGLGDSFEFSIDTGLLVPMDALRDAAGKDPALAIGVRGLLLWRL